MRRALLDAGRGDLIGVGCEALIPAVPPREAVEARREEANEAVKGDHYHAVPKPGKRKKGYRPGRKSAGRRAR